jgi:type IV secretory pathway VirD2 relaxase
VTGTDEEFRVRIGRARSGDGRSFVGQVERAARRAAQGARGVAGGRSGGGPGFGRARSAAVARGLSSPSRRVIVKARVVRHCGPRFRAAPLATHIAYLGREGATRDGEEGRMFDRVSDRADAPAFAEHCEDDRHHFRFIISPEDAGEMADLRAFTRELMADAARDLGTPLDWIAVDHWNTDNPHIHVLLRGRQADGQDLVINPDYIRAGLRMRAQALVSLELGPRLAREIATSLEREVEAERWTGLDRALRIVADEGGGVADLRPGGHDDPKLRSLLVGRAMKLQGLGLAISEGSGRWSMKPGAEETLRALADRGDIIKSLHRAMAGYGHESAAMDFAIHGDSPCDPVVGRLVARGLHDELTGAAYAIVEGVDGRTHHLTFAALEMTGDGKPGSVVEVRAYDDKDGRRRVTLANRSDLTIEAQVTAPGATWLDRRLFAPASEARNIAFGAEVQDALDRRVEHLIGEGLARRQGQRIVFARDLLDTLRGRELEAVVGKISREIGLPHHRRPKANPSLGLIDGDSCFRRGGSR